ncbi:ecotin precursor [Burkholderia thailandensis]|uniref:ecotin precursor n=1 Tax=Burkholderia thailandensis TaxID=57975 RepID=UPI0012E929F6|nr:ecotin precursor [Burkholderia thailandensis]MBS2131905.1 ecotin precursor [Burkholderia thailandensis]MCS6519577.1 ecotin precursor [Burkholderia thailandensis]MUV25736.1 ecotin precursor [Burkholderia thailandensis]NOK42990.1 ecotin precursor [Burkholderia thailandensis]NOK48448.1 ecotin precursor [Burkholderia thailandensis]
MKKIAAVLLTAGSLALAGPASAHDRGGDIVGALIGGAVLGAIVTSALNPAPAVAYAAPAYPAPVYQAPAYQPAQYRPASPYGGQPAGYCYDSYRRAYVGCGAQAYDDDGYRGYGYAQPQPAGW